MVPESRDDRWICTEERLPSDDRLVLAIAFGTVRGNIRLQGAYQLASYYSGEGWEIEEYPDAEKINVTYWRELPGPPEYPTKLVQIPARENHEGVYSALVRLRWICPMCGRKRGEIRRAISYDGSRYLPCDGWDNPCGHVDKYNALREEAANNDLNEEF